MPGRVRGLTAVFGRLRFGSIKQLSREGTTRALSIVP